MRCVERRRRSLELVARLEETMNTTHWELEAGTRRAGDGLLFVALLVSHGALGTLAGQALCAFACHDAWFSGEATTAGDARQRDSGGDERAQVTRQRLVFAASGLMSEICAAFDAKARSTVPRRLWRQIPSCTIAQHRPRQHAS